MAKWEEMDRGSGEEEKRGEEKKREKKLFEILIDVVNTMRNEPALSPVINYKHMHSTEMEGTDIHTHKLEH